MQELSNFTHILNLWQFKCRMLGIAIITRDPFILHLAAKVSTEKEAVKLIKCRFTPSWWEECLILEVDKIGKLHMIEDKPLYEED